MSFYQGIAGYEGKIPVAVKTLTSTDHEVVRKFMEEVELMKQFTHPNIVSLLGEYTSLLPVLALCNPKRLCFNYFMGLLMPF